MNEESELSDASYSRLLLIYILKSWKKTVNSS